MAPFDARLLDAVRTTPLIAALPDAELQMLAFHLGADVSAPVRC